MFVERRLDELSVEGNIEVLERLLDAAAPRTATRAPA
jgi:hypothetical protein